MVGISKRNWYNSSFHCKTLYNDINFLKCNPPIFEKTKLMNEITAEHHMEGNIHRLTDDELEEKMLSSWQKTLTHKTGTGVLYRCYHKDAIVNKSNYESICGLAEVVAR